MLNSIVDNLIKLLNAIKSKWDLAVITTLIILSSFSVLVYKVVDNNYLADTWYSDPRILKASPPCVYQQLRSNWFAVSIIVPTPSEKIETYSVSFWFKTDLDDREISQACNGLIRSTYSDAVEDLLTPYLKDNQEIYQFED